MIKRIWHGWTTFENAETYKNLLKTDIFKGIEDKHIPGYRSIELLVKERQNEVEFITIMTFDGLKNVIDFQGEDYEKCYVPDAAQKILTRWDKISEHFEVEEYRQYSGLGS